MGWSLFWEEGFINYGVRHGVFLRAFTPEVFRGNGFVSPCYVDVLGGGNDI